VNKKKILLIGSIVVGVSLAVAGSLYYWNELKKTEKLKDLDYNKTTEWFNVGEVPGSYTRYVDLKSIHVEGKYISVIVLMDYKKVHHGLNDLSAKKNLYFNCDTNNGYLKVWDKRYSGHMGSEAMIHEDIVEEIELKEPEVIFPHDLKILEVVCKTSKDNGDVTVKPVEPVKEAEKTDKPVEPVNEAEKTDKPVEPVNEAEKTDKPVEPVKEAEKADKPVEPVKEAEKTDKPVEPVKEAEKTDKPVEPVKEPEKTVKPAA